MLTFKKLKAQVKHRKNDVYYQSATTMYWTHLKADVKKTSKTRIKLLRYHEKFMVYNISSDARKRIQRNLHLAQKRGILYQDPQGNPLIECTGLKKFIEQAQQDPNQFGPGLLETFMAAHHQNCNSKGYATWYEYFLKR